MKTIKVFLASSDELRNERLEFADLVLQLNDLFERRDIQLKLVKWEHLDASMGIKHKQEEYNDRLRECELCLTLYWTKFGNFTAEELEIAYNELKEGRNPRKLYVFFKDAQEVSPELQQFKDSFATKYGHFFCKFENVDTMRLQFLLQLEAYHNSTSDRLLMVENQKVMVEGEPVVDLNNVPFAAMNKEFARLRDGIAVCEGEIAQFRSILSQMDNSAIEAMLNAKITERNKMQEEFNDYQGFLFDMARKTSQLSSQRLSERSIEAIRLFNEGNASEANGILNTEDMQRDTQQSFEDYHHHTTLANEAHKRIELIYNDWLLKANAALADENNPINLRILESENAYQQAKSCALTLKYNETDKVKYTSLIADYAKFSDKYAHYEKAKELCLEHIKLCEELYGLGSRDIALSYNNIGLVYEKQGDYAKSLDYFFKTLAIDEKILGTEHPSTATVYNNIGAVYDDQGDYSKALEYHFKALEINEKVLGSEHSSTATCYNNVGLVYCNQDNYPKALEYYLKAIAIYEKELGAEHTSTATCYNNIGFAYYTLDNSPKALEYYFKALEIYKKIIGLEHPSIATSYNNIGLVYEKQNDYTKALDYYFKALAIDEKVLGTGHPLTAISYNNIGLVYDSQGDYTEALDYFLKVLTINEKVLGSEHPNTETTKLWVRNTKYKIGNDLFNRELYSESLPYYLAALEIEETVLGEDEDTADSYNTIAKTYYHIGDMSNALAYHKKALNVRVNVFGEEHIDTAQSYFDVGDLYIDIKDYAKALDHLHRSLDIWKSLGVHSDMVAATHNNIGYTYNQMGEHNKAMEYHQLALTTRIFLFGEDTLLAANSYYHIGKTYNHLNQYSEALEWLNKALPIRERELGKEHAQTIATRKQIELANSKLTVD